MLYTQEYDHYLDEIERGIHLSNQLRMQTPPMNLASEKELELRSRKETAEKKFNKSFQILKYVKHLENSKQLDVECPICFELPTERVSK